MHCVITLISIWWHDATLSHNQYGLPVLFTLWFVHVVSCWYLILEILAFTGVFVWCLIRVMVIIYSSYQLLWLSRKRLAGQPRHVTGAFLEDFTCNISPFHPHTFADFSENCCVVLICEWEMSRYCSLWHSQSFDWVESYVFESLTLKMSEVWQTVIKKWELLPIQVSNNNLMNGTRAPHLHFLQN